MTTANTRFSKDNPISSGIWVGRAQEMLHAVRPYLNGDISKLTAGWVLEILHDKTGAVTQESQSVIQNMLERYPGFKPSVEGLYHYVFFRQLEFVCETTRYACAKALIQYDDRAASEVDRAESIEAHLHLTGPGVARRLKNLV